METSSIEGGCAEPRGYEIRKGYPSKDVAQYIIRECASKGYNDSLTPMQVLKLVYLAHGWVLGVLGRPLINEQVEAWTYGPVVPSLYRTMRCNGSKPVDHIDNASDIQLEEKERELVSQVCEHYGPMTGIKLSQLTHQKKSPWDIVWSEYGRSAVIPNDIIEEHYHRLATS